MLRSFSFSSPFAGGGVGFRKGPAPPSAEGDLAAGECAGGPAAGRAAPALPSSRRPPIQARSASSIAPVFFAPEVSSRFVLSCEFPIHRVGSLFFRSMLMLAFLVHVPVVSLALFAGAVLCGLSSRCVLLSPLVSFFFVACLRCLHRIRAVGFPVPSFVCTSTSLFGADIVHSISDRCCACWTHCAWASPPAVRRVCTPFYIMQLLHV